jgi:hypothetical protein
VVIFGLSADLSGGENDDKRQKDRRFMEEVGKAIPGVVGKLTEEFRLEEGRRFLRGFIKR